MYCNRVNATISCADEDTEIAVERSYLQLLTYLQLVQQPPICTSTLTHILLCTHTLTPHHNYTKSHLCHSYVHFFIIIDADVYAVVSAETRPN